MSTIINATTTNGVVIQPDNSGSLVLQTNNGTTALTIDTSQRAAFVAGTAALPAITTTGDTNTGMFFPAADTIAFAEGGTESMRIDSSGKLLVGTTTAASGGGVVQTIVGSGSNDGGIQVTSGTGVSGGGLAMNSSAGGGAKFFSFTGNAGSESYTERMRIDGSGNVNIGQSSAFGAGIRTTIKAADASSQSLALVSAVTSGTGTLQYLVDGSNDVCGYIGINATANTTSYNTSSDYRLKENIIPMTGALDKVSKLKPVLWNWKHAPEVIGQGFIAHELAEVIPDAVSGEKDAVDDEGKPVYQGIDTSFLVATLTAAIQEQQTIINDLKARVAVLEAK
jgi:hypothetical protein